MATKTKNKFVWVLTGNDPGTLGGPMGTEHIGPVVVSRVFTTKSKAKASAQRYVNKGSQKRALEWDKSSEVFESADGRWVLFEIERRVVR